MTVTVGTRTATVILPAAAIVAQLSVTHSGIATWVKVDTTDLWAVNGGTLSGAQTFLIDGVSAATTYGVNYQGEPTAILPIFWVMVAKGVHTFAVGSYSLTMDVMYRGGPPWTSLGSSIAGSINPANQFFFTNWAGDSNVPNLANSGSDGPPFQYLDALNNGYSLIPDSAPATSLVAIVAPGDQGFVRNGSPTADTRSEPTLNDAGNYTPVGLPPGGLDPFGNTSFKTGFYRQDAAIPLTYTAGVTVQNTTAQATLCTLSSPLSTGSPITTLPVNATAFRIGATACTITLNDGASHTQTWTTNLGAALAQGATSITVSSQTPSFAFPSGTTSVLITYFAYHVSYNQSHKWPDGVTVNPTTGTTAASATVTNNKATVSATSNIVESGGPAVWVWFGGTGVGTNGSTQFRYQPISLGIGIHQATFDTLPVVFGASDAATATTDGSRISTIVEYKPYLCALTNGVPWIVAAGTSDPVTGNPWSATNSVCPYGVPPGTPGGGYFRPFRWTIADPTYGNCWKCTSEGTSYAVPGQAPVYDATGALLNPGTVVANAGKVFGPTKKCNGALLATGPSGSSGVVISAADGSPDGQGHLASPFTFTVSSIVAATNFQGIGGDVFVGSELMRFSSFTGGNTFHITDRGVDGTTIANHSVGAQIAGLIETLVLSMGVNCSIPPTPVAVRQWPMLISDQFATVCGAPAVNYP